MDRRTQSIEIAAGALVAISVGVSRLFQPSPSTSRLIASYGCIVVGLFGLGLAAKVRNAVPRAARKKQKTPQKILYSGLHVYRTAESRDFNQLDMKFYEDTTRALERAGFRKTRDVVNLTVAKAIPKGRVVLRTLLGDLGVTMTAIYHLHIPRSAPGRQNIDLKIIDCNSELSDGTFISTANNLEAEKTLGYPFVDRLQLPLASSVDQLIKAHRDHLIAVIQKNPSVRPIKCNNYNDLRASQDRLQALQNAHRNSPDFDHAAERAKIAGRILREPEEIILLEEAETEPGET